MGRFLPPEGFPTVPNIEVLYLESLSRKPFRECKTRRALHLVISSDNKSRGIYYAVIVESSCIIPAERLSVLICPD